MNGQIQHLKNFLDDEENGEFGTINTIILVNANLGYETLLDAFMTATEAKTVALNDLKIQSQYSNGYATGTGTDGLCIFSNLFFRFRRQ